MLKQLESMWDGILVTLGHSAPHRAGAKVREFEKQEIDQMLTMDVVHPPQPKERLESNFYKTELALFASPSTTEN